MFSRFYISEKTVAYADSRLKNELISQLFNRFTYKTATIEIKDGESNTFIIGDINAPDIQSGCEYSILVNENGIAISAIDYPSLMRGYFSMLLKIKREMGKKELFIDPVYENKSFEIKNRMVHLCVFPENTLLEIKRYVRLFALLQYTHVVIEFWGMLKFDSLPALAWENAFTKDEVKEIISEARALGLETIPMFNSLAHASGARSISGKHVSLDNDLSLYHLFTPDGWAWDLESDEVWALLKSIRRELYELFDGCKYFHLGFDESHAHNKNPELKRKLPYYMSRLTKEVSSEGKRPMVWMDMLLPPEAFKNMTGNAHSVKSREECIEIIKNLDENTVFVDWEYSTSQAPISSVIYFKDLGIDVMGASWFDVGNAYAHIDTVAKNNLFGYMHTTWHTISKDLPNIVPIAKKLGATLPAWESESNEQMILSTLLRCITVEKTDYFSSGYVRKQI
ncbi:MAG: family 20 glycosylhydrolase [Clostridia bacterium]|nr:family 20 glycosylhydrolase [Clostridia bacterium]